MKRLWIGVVLLLVLLIAGITLTVSYDRTFRPLTQKMDEAAAAAVAGDWQLAAALSEEAGTAWSNLRNRIAAVADQSLLEEMDSLFAQMELMKRLQATNEFTILCCQLARLAEAFADSQSIQWWSLL